jgi:hypothetical protein
MSLFDKTVVNGILGLDGAISQPEPFCHLLFTHMLNDISNEGFAELYDYVIDIRMRQALGELTIDGEYMT